MVLHISILCWGLQAFPEIEVRSVSMLFKAKCAVVNFSTKVHIGFALMSDINGIPAVLRCASSLLHSSCKASFLSSFLAEKNTAILSMIDKECHNSNTPNQVVIRSYLGGTFHIGQV